MEIALNSISERETMKTTLAAMLFILCATLCGQTVHAQELDNDQPLNFVIDSAISAAIRVQLSDAWMFTLSHINVDTDDHGVVVLSGHARNKEQVDKAISIARHTSGVVAVQNHITIAAD